MSDMLQTLFDAILKGDSRARVRIAGGRILEEIDTFALAAQADAIISVPVMKPNNVMNIFYFDPLPNGLIWANLDKIGKTVSKSIITIKPFNT